MRAEPTTAPEMGREKPDPASRAGAGAGAKSSATASAAEQTARMKAATKKAVETEAFAIGDRKVERERERRDLEWRREWLRVGFI